MKGWNRFAALLLALGLIFGMIAPAGAEVMTLGVYFRGILEKEDGTRQTLRRFTYEDYRDRMD